MNENCKHPALAVAETLDRITIPALGLIDAVVHSTPGSVVAQLCPDYLSIEKSLEDTIGSIDFERENQELHDLIYRFIDVRSVLIWRLAGPIFLRLAGCTDQQIARTCSMLAIGGAGSEPRLQIVEG